ncbi:MAG: aminoacyl-tRNA hydrolase [Paenibacillaceae bacterium]|jgi:PTH1 family peptidyl-tRNA hydrolase|nr:aminoacyl-tRNA hydrolase [Paenibacillaceae bacterium]
MKWFVGLGNPGAQYGKTRHNVGFMAVDRIAAQWGLSWKENGKCKALIAEGAVAGNKVALVKPQTYMNLSGESVRAFMNYYKAGLDDMIVLYDDLDTVFGQIRLRYQGSAGGHNGIKSIIAHTGTQTFNRIRIGISRPAPGYDIANYVLSDFRKEEAKELPLILERTADAVAATFTGTFEQAMGKYNG